MTNSAVTEKLSPPISLSDNFSPTSLYIDEEQFSLEGLSPQAHQLIVLASSTPDLLETLLGFYVENKEKAWSEAESLVGALSEFDRRLLERLIEVFNPGGFSNIVVAGDQGIWAERR